MAGSPKASIAGAARREGVAGSAARRPIGAKISSGSPSVAAASRMSAVGHERSLGRGARFRMQSERGRIISAFFEDWDLRLYAVVV
jgi:hypothetical protein